MTIHRDRAGVTGPELVTPGWSLCCAVVVALMLLLWAVAPAAACTEAWEECVTLTNGTLIIERRISFGELFVGLSMLAVFAVLTLRWLFDLARELR